MPGKRSEGSDAPASRRERGVIAQREYRKRHATKVQTLQDENTTLKNAIADIDRALMKDGSISAELSSILVNARRVAGLLEPQGREDNARAEADGPQHGETLPDRPHVQDQDQAQPPIPGPTPLNLLDQAPESSSLLQPPRSGHYSALSAATGHLSPRLDYGLWTDTDRLVRIFDPPEDITPYIGAGARTLPGVIFWTCMTRTIALWKDHCKALASNASSGTKPTSTSPATGILRRIFSTTSFLQDPGFLMSLAQSRLDYKQKGYMFGRLQEQFQCNSTPELAEMHRQAEDHHTAQGQPPSMWKTPADVAAMIVSHLDEDETARMDAVLQGHGPEADANLLSIMVNALANHFVCFGDGPRWNVIYVHMALGGWLKLVHDPTVPRTWDTSTPIDDEPEGSPDPRPSTTPPAPVSPPSPGTAAERSGGATSTDPGPVVRGRVEAGGCCAVPFISRSAARAVGRLLFQCLRHATSSLLGQRHRSSRSSSSSNEHIVLVAASSTTTPIMERTPPAVELQSQCSTVANRSARVSMGLEKLAAQSSPTSDVGDELRELAGVVSALSQSAEELGQNLTNSSSLAADARRQLSSSLSACELLLGGVTSDLEEALSTSSREPSELQAFIDAAELWRLHIELVFAFQDLTQMADSDEQQATLMANETKFEDLERLMAEFQLSHPMPEPAEPEPAIPPEKGGVLPDYDTVIADSSSHLSMASSDTLHEQYEQPEVPLDQHLGKQKGKSKAKSSKGVFGGFGSIFKTISSKINPVEPLVTPLCHAASSGNIPQMKGLLAEGAHINGHNEKGHTPLIAAILANRLDAVSYLLDNHVKVTTKDSSRSMPPLFHAAEAGYLDIVNLLLSHGADAKASSAIGTPFFIETVEKAPLASVALLLEHGADPNAVSAVGRHVLVAAVQRNDLPAVRLLLDHGAKISATNITGQPLLGLAVANKRLDMAKLLIDNGANVDARAGSNGCPLSVATNTRNIELLRLLLAANANPNGKDVKGAPVLVNAVLKASLEMVTMLLDAGADPDARDITGRAVLLVAVQQDKLPIARLLLEHGASPTVSGHSGTHFLTLFAKQLAPDEDKADFMRLLLKCGADPNRHSLPWGYISNIPLGHCVKYDKVELVRVLMGGGADPHITVPASPNSPKSPFEYALSHDKVDAMRIILTHHDRDKKGEKGKDPIQAGFSAAIETGKTEMVDLFLDQGLGSLDRAIFLAGTSGQRDLLVALEARQKIRQRLEWELESPRLEAGPVSSPIEASGGQDGEGAPPAYAAAGPSGRASWKQ